MNKKYLICNLKSNMVNDELIVFEKNISSLINKNNLELVICPPSPFFYLFQGQSYILGSQEISMYGKGAYTGEVCAPQLKSLNVKYSLIGHSESRQILKETEKSMISKIKQSLSNNIIPIFFIGETKEENENNLTKNIIEKELLTIFDNLTPTERNKMIIAYEPIWSIGTGLIPTPSELLSLITYIKQILSTKYYINIPILYGGSVNTDNIDTISQIANIDGIVLGESSTNYQILKEIYQKYQKII